MVGVIFPALVAPVKNAKSSHCRNICGALFYNTYMIPSRLQEIYNRFDDCERCRTEKNDLKHVLGGGKFHHPKFLFLFINPTHLNISVHQEYEGDRRYPFLGVRHFYRLLSEAGFVDSRIVEDVYSRGWRVSDEERVEESLVDNDVYITNLVKCAQRHPDNPLQKVIKEDLSLLMEEIDIVSPQHIVVFGGLVFKTITGDSIVLRDCLDAVRNGSYSPYQSIEIKKKSYPVLPCYFPVGRGNPRGALEILKHIRSSF